MGATQRLFQEGLVLYALVAFGLLVWSVQAGWWWAAPLVVLASSPVLLAVLAVFVEKRNLGNLVDFGRNGWSFLIGDTFVLTAAMAAAAFAWQTVPKAGWYMTWQWVLGAAVIGLAAGLAFHAWDGGNYIRDGAELLLNSPTKLAHDLVAYPVLFGGLVCVGVPVFATWSNHPVCAWILFGCLMAQLLLMGADAGRGLVPFDMHPSWDAQNFRVVR